MKLFKFKHDSKPYVYDPEDPIEKIADFCEHVFLGGFTGFILGVLFGALWILTIQK